MGMEGGLLKDRSKTHNGGESEQCMGSKRFRVIFVMVLIATVTISAVAIFTRLTAISKSSLSYSVEVPLYFHPVEKKYFVMMQIEGKRGWMLLDTGSSITILDEAQFNYESFGQTKIATKQVYMPFSNAYLTVKKVQIHRLIIGSWKAPPLTVGLARRSAVGIPASIQGYPVLGLLGYDVISLWTFVWLRKDRLTFTNRHPEILGGTGKIFPLAYGLRVLCFREVGDNTVKKRIWVVDSGSVCHYAKEANLRVSYEYSSPWAVFTAARLNALENQTLWLPAVATAAHSSPLVWGSRPIEGVIGNGILSRYEIFINHREGWISFVELSPSSQLGTFGLLLFNDPQRNKMLVYFAVPQGTYERSNSLVELLAVNGRRIDGMADLVKLVQKPQSGSSVRLTVRDSSRRDYEVTCLAFSPDEIGAMFYKGSLRVDGFEYTFTALKTHHKEIWLYPFRWALGERGKIELVSQASIATLQSGISLGVSNIAHSRKAKPGGSEWKFTMEIRPLH
ncbi:MAG: hypothetical protein KatS3mg016_1990 [Fimbriimonadales bacterium]|nr:MAG: hypothetical protein KatS3mg016_1990 [Fimbriimonadales bacterium]